MKRTRNLLAIILSLVMIFTALPLTAITSFAVTSGDFEYEILDDGTAVITGYNGTATELTIPSEIDGYTVTSIYGWAFKNCTSLESVTIPDSVTSIGNYAFDRCTSLESITIGNSVTSIGDVAFFGCTSLTNINVSADNANYTTVDGVLFNKDKTELICYPAGKEATTYAIPNSVTSIGDWAFIDCTSLASVTIPDSVTSIGYGAFSYCTSLESITIGNGVTSIDWNAFKACTSLTSIKIPDSVTSIGGRAFDGCTSLASVTIPDSVTSIGDWAFIDCTSLKSVTIGNSVTSIDDSAFGYYYGDFDEYAGDYIKEKVEGFTIYGYVGSEAERYANDNEFAFVALEKPDPIPDPSPDPDLAPSESIGDVNGDEKLSIVDAKWILQNLASTRDFTAEQKAFADVNGDGKISIVDVKWILQVLAGTRELS